MTVRDLRKYLEERNLVHSQKLTALQNTRIGVDGFHWLTQLLHERTEPFQVAMGGLPITLTNKIEKEINRWKSAGITPVFVFNGISHKKVDVGPSPIKAHTFVVAEELERKRRSAFNAFERGQVKEASALFITASALPTDFINYLFQYFTEHNIEFFRAPYVTWGQLAHFMNEKEPMIHAIYAADEQIMFNVPKLILDVNFEDEIFRYVDKNEILANLGLNESQFLDCCLLAGSFFGKTMPHIVEFVKKDSDKKAFAIALEMVQVYRSGLVVTQFDHDSATQFLFSKALINNHVILESDGTAGHLNPGSVPKDYNEVIGPKLPNDLYYLLSQSVISPQALSSLVAGAVLETQPLADSQEYHALISSLSHLRSASFNLLTTPLNEYFQKKPISVIYWPAGDIPTQELDRSILKITDGLCWQLSDADIQKQLKLQKSQAIDFQFCLNWKPAPSTSLTTKFTTPEQLRSFLLLKTLDVLGYFTKTRSSYDLNPYARALQRAKLYPDQAIIILELLRNQAMTTRRFSLVFKKYAASITAPVKKSKFQAELILIERVMSMVPMTFKFIQWGERAGVSQDLLCYNSIVKILYKSMRQVIEMLLAATFLEGHCDLELTQNLCLTRLSIHLPFFQETNTAMGVVARYLLETPVDTLSVDQLPKKFTSCVDVVADFRDRAVPFWNQTVDMVRTLYGAKSGLDAYGASILEQFESADKFLQEKLESLSTLGQKNQ